MKDWKRALFVTLSFLCLSLIRPDSTVSAASTKKVTINLNGSKTLYKYPAALEKAKKVSVKSSKKSVVTAKYKKTKKVKRIVLTAKKKGTATVTVKCTMKNKKVKTYKYKVTVVKKKKTTALDDAKKAFEIQNQYRKEKGVAELEWSDELYQFCLYRLKTSGFDKHKNLGRDTGAYFGIYGKYKKLLFSENLYNGYSDPASAMKAWKNSSGHYRNLLSAEHKCGAIARYGNTWCAIFYDEDKSQIDNWRQYKIKEVNVKRFDSQKGAYVSGCSIGYYEANNRLGTIQSAMISDVSGKKIYLEVGKTYIIYEKTSPVGSEKAESLTITVTDDSINEVVLKDK